MANASAKLFSAVFRAVFRLLFAELAGRIFLAYGRFAMKRNIVIYQDEGVGEFGLKCLEKFFAADDVWLATAEAVIDGRVLGMADIFVMPGGADLPYCKKLNGLGNDNIRAYVEEGGTYLGICAGAYYGCHDIEYHKGRDDEICEKRELKLIDAVAYGSLPFKDIYYNGTHHSASVQTINTENGSMVAFYNGGCAFRVKDEAIVLARYEGGTPAIVGDFVGAGCAILSGIHFEIRPDQLILAPVGDASEITVRDGLAKALSSYSAGHWHQFLDQQIESLSA
jgi:glutamine amidotransferase-like uncharacterized protein